MENAVRAPKEPLVGRRDEREAILAMLGAERRVVTITGPAGVGKTCLAVHVAADLVAQGRAAHAWRCDLGEARDAAGICDAVAQAIGASATPNQDPAARIGLALEARGAVLVVLDEAEGVAAIAGEILGQWLVAAPLAAFLVTSREPLRITEESLFELRPLAVPVPDSAAGASGARDVEAGARESSAPRSEAVELFVRCAGRARHGYALSDAEAPFVAALVRELDGLPLAIELCAPRMAVMGAAALLHRMTSRFDVLRKKAARPGDRHATLAAAIDASFSALSPDEQSALAQCAVFRGGFTLEAAEAVVSLPPRAGPVLDVLQGLREKSLLQASESADGELRLGLLASVRAFVADKIGPAERAAASARHAHHVVRIAEAHERNLRGRDGALSRARIVAERDNLLDVIERVLGQGPVTARAAEPALRALLVLASLSPYDGPLATFARALDPVLSATKDSGADPALSGRALLARGQLLLSRGDARSGSRDLVQALAVARTLGDASLEARATLALGLALAARGDAASAIDHFQRATEAFFRLGDAGSAASATASLARIVARLGRLDEASALLERALAIHRAERDLLGEADDLQALGHIAADRGDLDAARARLTAGLGAARAAPDRRATALALGALALVDQLDRRFDAARAGYEAAAAALAEIGLAAAEAVQVGSLGVLLREMGAPEEAFARLVVACDRVAEGDPHLPLFLAHLAWLDADIGREDAARAAIARATAHVGREPDRAAAAVIGLARARLDPTIEGTALASARAEETSSAHVRIALRCLPDATTAAPSAVAAAPPPPDALIIGPAGLWFRAPHGERVLLDRRRQLAKILDHLAAERAARPGAALGWDALLAAAWPGERVLPEAAAHRVRVAVSTLRKLGLRDVLRTSEEGYLLVPDVPLSRAI